MAETPTLEEICERHGIVPGDLDTEVSEKGLLCLEEHCLKWEFIAPRLGLQHKDISDIKKENDTEEKRRVAFLRKWKRKFLASYLVLLKILCFDMKEGGTADEAVKGLVEKRILPKQRSGT